jgi:hypothetical protein
MQQVVLSLLFMKDGSHVYIMYERRPAAYRQINILKYI